MWSYLVFLESVDWRGIQLNYWISKSFSKLFSKSLFARRNSIELLKIYFKILLRWILLKGHVPTSLSVLLENLFQKDFEKDFQNVNRIATLQKTFLSMNFNKILKNNFNNPIEFLSRLIDLAPLLVLQVHLFHHTLGGTWMRPR